MTTKAVAILQLLICGGSARIVQVDTDTTFVVGHRISMVHPGHLDTLSDRDELHIEIKVKNKYAVTITSLRQIFANLIDRQHSSVGPFTWEVKSWRFQSFSTAVKRS